MSIKRYDLCCMKYGVSCCGSMGEVEKGGHVTYEDYTAAIEALQAKLDSVMLEFCPEGTETVDDIAERISDNVICHIDKMYPDMWKFVSKTARKSVKNTVSSEVMLNFK